MPCARLSWPFRQLLSNVNIPSRIVSYRIERAIFLLGCCSCCSCV